jgi:hypothetical protein
MTVQGPWLEVLNVDEKYWIGNRIQSLVKDESAAAYFAHFHPSMSKGFTRHVTVVKGSGSSTLVPCILVVGIMQVSANRIQIFFQLVGFSLIH